VKMTTAAIMREGARIVKEEEELDKRYKLRFNSYTSTFKFL